MSEKQRETVKTRVRAAARELQDLIAARFPEAQFQLVRGDDPEGFYLKATVDVEDPDEVAEAVRDRLLEMEIEQGLPLYLIPLRPTHRVLAYERERRPQPSFLEDIEPLAGTGRQR